MRSLEQTLSAVLLASAREQPPVRPEWRAEMERMAERSRERYRGLVYESPDFPRFFEQSTPIAELTSLNIGSRPSKRARGRDRGAARDPLGVRMDAEPAAAAVVVRRGRRARRGRRGELQREMLAGWPFFQSLLSTLEMALYKTDLGVAERYLRLVEPELRDRFWPDIAREHDLVVGRLLEITGEPSLLGDSPALQRRLSHRNPWIDPLTHLQVELLAAPAPARPTRATRCWRRSPGSPPGCATRAEAAARRSRPTVHRDSDTRS